MERRKRWKQQTRKMRGAVSSSSFGSCTSITVGAITIKSSTFPFVWMWFSLSVCVCVFVELLSAELKVLPRG